MSDTQSPRVYLLSDHGEHGSENVVATLDPSRLPELLKANWAYANDEMISHLGEMLLTDKVRQTPESLGMGWGGVQLHVVELS